ncbi:MAG: hypothetical protein ACYTGV_17565 [Planctomycetota bacterium]|jgi:hypothetical protein
MYVLIALVATLLLIQLGCAQLARTSVSRMMRPADDWEDEDIDRWLALIEPFPLEDPTRAGRRD